MFTIRKIESLDLPELEPYRSMRRQLEHRTKGIFVAEGEKVVRRLLESELEVMSLLLPNNWAVNFEPLLLKRLEQIDVFVAEKSLLEKLTGFSMYQGVLGIGKVPVALSLDTILERSARPWLFAASDGLSSAENLGALVRNCVAFNVQALIVGETCCSPFLRRAVRSSMGTIFHLPIIEAQGLAGTLRELKEVGVRCIAAHPHDERQTLSQVDFRNDCCVVFGSEGQGLTPDVLNACDESVAIPMPWNVDSLNVGSAAAVFLYEANQQRRGSAEARNPGEQTSSK
jgi:tRNA G18 (ribose-2'-O)-methylase SpoU